MFRPNQIGLLYKIDGYDVYAQEIMTAPVMTRFAVVDLNVGAIKTPVRADSSATRGSADEMVVERGKVLIEKKASFEIEDVFEFRGQQYKIASKHERFDVCGNLDHFEVGLELRASQ